MARRCATLDLILLPNSVRAERQQSNGAMKQQPRELGMIAD